MRKLGRRVASLATVGIVFTSCGILDPGCTVQGRHTEYTGALFVAGSATMAGNTWIQVGHYRGSAADGFPSSIASHVTFSSDTPQIAAVHLHYRVGQESVTFDIDPDLAMLGPEYGNQSFYGRPPLSFTDLFDALDAGKVTLEVHGAADSDSPVWRATLHRRTGKQYADVCTS